MTMKTNRPQGPASPLLNGDTGEWPWRTPAGTMDERLQRIEALGERVRGCVQYICGVCGLGGTSGEAKEKAIAAFYERMVVLERQLSRIRDDLQCG